MALCHLCRLMFRIQVIISFLLANMSVSSSVSSKLVNEEMLCLMGLRIQDWNSRDLEWGVSGEPCYLYISRAYTGTSALSLLLLINLHSSWVANLNVSYVMKSTKTGREPWTMSARAFLIINNYMSSLLHNWLLIGMIYNCSLLSTNFSWVKHFFTHHKQNFVTFTQQETPFGVGGPPMKVYSTFPKSPFWFLYWSWDSFKNIFPWTLSLIRSIY